MVAMRRVPEGQLGFDFVPPNSRSEAMARLEKTVGDMTPEAAMLQTIDRLDLAVREGRLSDATDAWARLRSLRELAVEQIRAAGDRRPPVDIWAAMGRAIAAPPGQEPKWGQPGDFVTFFRANLGTEHEVSCAVRVKYDGIADFDPWSFELEPFDYDKEFVSETGFLALRAAGPDAAQRRTVGKAAMEGVVRELAYRATHAPDGTKRKTKGTPVIKLVPLRGIVMSMGGVGELPAIFPFPLDDPAWQPRGYLGVQYDKAKLAEWTKRARTSREAHDAAMAGGRMKLAAAAQKGAAAAKPVPKRKGPKAAAEPAKPPARSYGKGGGRKAPAPSKTAKPAATGKPKRR